MPHLYSARILLGLSAVATTLDTIPFPLSVGSRVKNIGKNPTKVVQVASIALRIHVNPKFVIAFLARITAVAVANGMAITCILESIDRVGRVVEPIRKVWPTTVPGRITTKCSIGHDVDGSKVGKVVLVVVVLGPRIRRSDAISRYLTEDVWMRGRITVPPISGPPPTGGFGLVVEGDASIEISSAIGHKVV